MMKYIVCGLAILMLISACGEPPFTQGQVIYKSKCANCHIEDGSGLRGVVPPLVGSKMFKNEHLAELSCIIYNGQMAGKPVNGKVYELNMPANKDMTAVEIANLINYLTNEWGEKDLFIKTDFVETALRNCP